MNVPRSDFRYWLVFLILAGFSPASVVHAQEEGKVGAAGKEAKSARRVFVLHSGIHTIIADPAINISAERLEKGLLKRGAAQDDVVRMSNPFPKASWKNMFPKEAVEMFLESTDPSSKVVHDAYLRMHRALREKKVGTEDEVIWIGHSAGGQLGMTVAHLALTLDKHPEFAKQVQPYRITTVITLGTPVGANLLPEEVRLRNYYSDGDDVVRLAVKTRWLTSVTFGFKGKLCPHAPTLCKNWKARVFDEVQHNSWTKEERILDRLFAEFDPECCPCWHSALYLRPGMGLTQLLCHVLDQELHLSFEDPPRFGDK